MGKGRLEAFSDGVLAIILTIMVLEFKVPQGSSFLDLQSLSHELLSYIVSFTYIGIYWNNHHHLMHAVKKVNGTVLWANLHLLFWLSLTPFATAWSGRNAFAAWPVAFYGVVLFFAGMAYYLLTLVLVAHHGRDSLLAKAIGNDVKGKISILVYAVGVGLAFYHSWMAYALYALVALMWLIPDRRIEKILVS